MKKLLQSKLKALPQEQQDMIMTLMEKDPQLFQDMSKEIKEKQKEEGLDEQTASMQVMFKYKDRIQKLMILNGAGKK